MADDGQQTAEFKLAAIESGLMRDAVRKEAAVYGLIDPSDIDHISIEGVTIGANGTVNGAKELVENFKQSKPHWFEGSAAKLSQKRAAETLNADYAKGVKPGSPEHKQLEQDYLNRLSR